MYYVLALGGARDAAAQLQLTISIFYAAGHTSASRLSSWVTLDLGCQTKSSGPACGRGRHIRPCAFRLRRQFPQCARERGGTSTPLKRPRPHDRAPNMHQSPTLLYSIVHANARTLLSGRLIHHTPITVPVCTCIITARN